MDRYTDTVQNEIGNAVSGASVLILDANGFPASIFADRAGANPLANPIITNFLGQFSFCAADGLYAAQVSIAGKFKAEQRDIRLEDPTNDSIPIASTTTAGIVKIGTGLVMDGDILRLPSGAGNGTVITVNGIEADDFGDVELSTDVIPEGETNQWFTLNRVRGAVLTGLSLANSAAITAADSVLTAFGKLQKQISDLVSAKDAASGYAGLTGFAINLKNAAGTVIAKLASAATAERTWTFPDKNGTVAMVSDLPTVLLGTITVSSTTAQVDFLSVFSSTYNKYVIEIEGMAMDAQGGLAINMAVAGAVDAANLTSPLSASGGTNSTQSILLLTSGQLAGATGTANFTLTVLNVNGTGQKTITAAGSWRGAVNVWNWINGASVYSNNAAVSGFRLTASAGNIISGTVRVFGVKSA